MSLRSLIRYKKAVQDSGGASSELVLPGEPMIYSIKYTLGSRTHSVQFFRDKKWQSILKSYFKAYMKTSSPVVILVRFYVTPSPWVGVKKSEMKKETVPAVSSYELTDYLLSFMEMLHHVLIASYKQVAHISMEKFYSDNPRTVFEFMHWSDYAKLKGEDTLHPKTKGLGASNFKRSVQPKCKGDEPNAPVCDKPARRQKASPAKGPTSCDSALPLTCPIVPAWKKKATAAWMPSREKA